MLSPYPQIVPTTIFTAWYVSKVPRDTTLTAHTSISFGLSFAFIKSPRRSFSTDFPDFLVPNGPAALHVNTGPGFPGEDEAKQ
ncbi:hypothetical protein VTO58DRAFT_105921 [Aureobasidium pullulans]